MTQQNLPRPGQRFHHFKDKLYQVITIATHSETGEKLVIYQALYDDYEIYARPLNMFLSEVDHEKYPEVTQERRFEPVEQASVVTAESPVTSTPTVPTEKQSEDTNNGIEPKLMAFLDAETYEDRYKILSTMGDIVDDHMIDTMAVVLDMVIKDGDIVTRYQELKNCIRTQMRYETSRFRK